MALVTHFVKATVEPPLRALVPDRYCKGTDDTTETVLERKTARALGIRVAITDDPKSHAPRDLIAPIRGDR